MFNIQYMFNMYWILNIIEHHWWSYLFSLSECWRSKCNVVWIPLHHLACLMSVFLPCFSLFSSVLHRLESSILDILQREPPFSFINQNIRFCFPEIELIFEKRATQMPVWLFSTPRCNLYDHESAGETSEIENNALYEPVQHRSHGYSPLPWFSLQWFVLFCQNVLSSDKTW